PGAFGACARCRAGGHGGCDVIGAHEAVAEHERAAVDDPTPEPDGIPEVVGDRDAVAVDRAVADRRLDAVRRAGAAPVAANLDATRVSGDIPRVVRHRGREAGTVAANPTVVDAERAGQGEDAARLREAAVRCRSERLITRDG